MNIPELNEGETNIGAIGNQTGDAYHLILLAGDNDHATHQKQLEWAQSIGGDLPTKIEAAMLFAHAKDQFQRDWYWTNETFVDPDEPEDTRYAWVQSFRCRGRQYFTHKGLASRARAVRRLPI